MNLLSIDHVTKEFSDKKVLNDASFYLHEGEKVGVIGVNGCGKSTLLKLMAGLEEADGGEVIAANHVVCTYLPQSPAFDDADNVLKRAAGGHKESEAKAMLTRLGITDFDKPVKELSGGQKKRVALVSVLLADSEVLLLDEPTNHLDQEMSDWLEDYLRKRKGAFVMVTHDRYFLDSVCTRIIEVDKGNIYSYETNYSGYLELKAQREEMEQASERKRQSILKNELAWIQRGARARSTKQKARIERYEQLMDQNGPAAEKRVELGSVASRLGRTTVEVENISMAYGENLLIRDFSYIFLKGDRVGFLGPNGCGKTTLMKLIAGRLIPTAGNIVVGQTVKIGYYTQEMENSQKGDIAYMNPNQRVIDYIREIAEYVETPEGKITASKMLERFLFEGAMQFSILGKLSGGEKRRLNLLRVLMQAPNVLILDEPTNDLDIATLTVLEDYLDSFAGIVITVSHDRYFLDRTVKRIFAFGEDGHIRQYEGGYTDYISHKEMELLTSGISGITDKRTGSMGSAGNDTQSSANSAGTGAPKKELRNKSRKLKFTYQEQKDFDVIEDEIAELEESIENLDSEIGKSAHDFIKLNELMEQKEKAETFLEEKMQRWMYLEELAQKIERGELCEN